MKILINTLLSRKQYERIVNKSLEELEPAATKFGITVKEHVQTMRAKLRSNMLSDLEKKKHTALGIIFTNLQSKNLRQSLEALLKARN